MKKSITRYLVLNIGLLALLVLIALSIAGAFMGAQRAAVFFNSPPLAAVWIALTALLIAAFFFWKSLYRRPFLLLCHLGCIAILSGGLWGSAAAHRLRTAAGMDPKLIKGVIMLRQGQTASQVTPQDQTGEFELPFSVHLAQTGVTHYDEPSIGIYSRAGSLLGRIGTDPGYVYQLNEDPYVEVLIKKRFENLRLERDEHGITGVEGDSDKSNPGYEIHFSLPGGRLSRQYVFELFEPHALPDMQFIARYLPPYIPKEYKSLLIIEKDGRTLAQKTIRVNDPLHFGGYHFYQSTFGQDQIGPYSGIMVVSDSGILTVFIGYGMLTVGLFGQYWILPILRRRKHQEAA